jgi:hypothetical protein
MMQLSAAVAHATATFNSKGRKNSKERMRNGQKGQESKEEEEVVVGS